MYLTGQSFARPWMEPEGATPIKKTHSFYGTLSSENTKTNLWDNRYRTCNKVYNFYQRGQEMRVHTFNEADHEGRQRVYEKQLSCAFIMENKKKRKRLIS